MTHRFHRNRELSDYIDTVILNATDITDDQLIRELTVLSLTLLEDGRVSKIHAITAATP